MYYSCGYYVMIYFGILKNGRRKRKYLRIKKFHILRTLNKVIAVASVNFIVKR